MSRTSPVAIGTAFESHSLRFLNHNLHMSLRRVGGAGDDGIDLKGWWYVPTAARRSENPTPPPRLGSALSEKQFGLGKVRRVQEEDSPIAWTGGLLDGREGHGDRDGEGEGEREGEGVFRRLRVVGQCKAEQKKLNGRTVRELEGVMGHLHGREALRGPHQFTARGKPLDRPPPESIAILLSQSGFSEKAMIRAWRSPSPMMLVHLPGGRPVTATGTPSGSPIAASGEEGEIMVEGAWWNPALAGPRGIFGGHIEFKREILDSSGRNAATGEAEVKARYRVWYAGKRMPRFGPALDEEVD